MRFNKKTMPVIYLCLLAFFFPPLASAQTTYRSLDRIFPGLTENQIKAVHSEEGLIRSLKKNEPLGLIPASDSGINLHLAVLKAKPSYLAEAIFVVPYTEKVYSKLDAYNALGRIRGLKGRTYRSYTRKAEVPLFEDATRIESEKRTANAIPDPPPAKVIPPSETVYIRLKDANFGTSFYKSELSESPYGVTFSLTNFKNLTYLLFTVMKEEKFSAILYLEPLAEGILLYSVTGADASDFIASKIDVPSAIEKRMAVFIGWVIDELRTAR